MFSAVEVEKKIKNFHEIGNIVEAMKAYAGIAVRKANDIVRNVRVCEENALQALADIVACAGNLAQPAHVDGKRILVVFGSSLGLCGMFNEKVAQRVADIVTVNDSLIVIGKRLHHLTESLTLGGAGYFEAPASLDGIKKSLQLSLSGMKEIYAEKEYYSLTFVFTSVSENRADIYIEQVLPPDLGVMRTSRSDCHPLLTYEEPGSIFMGILEEFLKISLYRCYVESLRSENWFRLRTMEGAAESLKKRLDDLSSLQNYLRQEEVTAEMLEILGGGMFYR